MGENRADDFSRRSFLKGTAAVSLGTAVGATSLGTAVSAAWMAPAAAAELPPTPPHGAELRGMDLVIQSPTTEGRFGFMFKNQPPYRPSDELLETPGCTEWRNGPAPSAPSPTLIRPPASCSRASRRSRPDTLLDSLGATMEEQPPPTRRLSKDETTPPTKPQPSLTSGFTFVGQFVDHDITFDTTQLNDQQSDPYATTNFRTPRYDLDAIYGLGPSTNPQFYDPSDRDKFLIVERPYNQITGKLKRPDGVDETKTWDVKPDVV